MLITPPIKLLTFLYFHVLTFCFLVHAHLLLYYCQSELRTERTWPEVSFEVSKHLGMRLSAIIEDMLDKLALKIRQGFALPKPDLSTFESNPMKYWSFIRSFENTIKQNAISESEKLMYLLQYTLGNGKKSTECCVVIEP